MIFYPIVFENATDSWSRLCLSVLRAISLLTSAVVGFIFSLDKFSEPVFRSRERPCSVLSRMLGVVYSVLSVCCSGLHSQ